MQHNSFPIHSNTFSFFSSPSHTKHTIHQVWITLHYYMRLVVFRRPTSCSILSSPLKSSSGSVAAPSTASTPCLEKKEKKKKTNEVSESSLHIQYILIPTLFPMAQRVERQKIQKNNFHSYTTHQPPQYATNPPPYRLPFLPYRRWWQQRAIQ